MGGAGEGFLSAAGYSTDIDTPANKQLVATFKKDNQIDPDLFGADTYGLFFLFKQAIEKAGGTDEQKLRGAMEDASWETPQGMEPTVLTTEEEGIGILAGAWLGGERGVLLMQSSGVGNCINTLSLAKVCGFPLLMIVTMRSLSDHSYEQAPRGYAWHEAPPILAEPQLGGEVRGWRLRLLPFDDPARRGRAAIGPQGRWHRAASHPARPMRTA